MAGFQPVQCFWSEPTGFAHVYLRRFAYTSMEGIPACPGDYHNAQVIKGTMPSDEASVYHVSPDDPLWHHPDWPVKCAHCDYRFDDVHDQRQHFIARVYRGGGREFELRSPPPGALWDADWYGRPGADGINLVAVCPDGREWFVDGRASNCTLPDDQEHYCWLRTGDPRHPETLTVSKSAPGFKTCAAGGGSIDTGHYHGFLRAGVFTAG